MMMDKTARLDGISRRKLLKASAVGVGSLGLAGCTSANTPQDVPTLAGSVPELDLDTLQAETPAGTITAEQIWAENTYVGAVDEELYIGISFPEDPKTAQEATVYLCDGEMAEYLTGEVRAGTNMLEGELLDIELSFDDGVVSGVVIQDGEEPRPFVANEATGDAGLYSAEFTFESDEYRPYWIVLADGSQRGQACWRCCGRICTICCCAPGSCLVQKSVTHD
ncbi:twin-arginine translocation signal domain-containing protein [Salinirubellus salinus]|uniref:Twin-arginine translocation signal domain-containing protein n=1 Tax=Salinirubellus salinus TaxID=1364945 RepID=A0A9E7R0J3_9EURY|nr:twin-arginine translocation signal domain-containing protein [Salinirubellus salinus]UWM53451.1 twin-arginine translocation signal domain-containing protein [Salinirubellus salinus]